VSSFERIKYLATSSRVIYLDGGYQHYFKFFGQYENYFYTNVNDLLLNIFAIRLNYRSKVIRTILFTNQSLTRQSDCVDLVKGVGKYREDFGVVKRVNEDARKKAIIDEIFPEFDPLTLSVTNGMRSVCILTQPFSEDGNLSLNDNISVYRNYLETVDFDKTTVYLKGHPREVAGKYSGLANDFDLILLSGGVPFEVYEMNDVVFDLGITVNSTSVYSKCFTEQQFLNPSEV